MSTALTSVSDFGVKVIVLSIVLTLLPSSPLSGFNYLLANLPYLNFLNWFLPITEMIVILESWLLVVSIYYSIIFLINYAGVAKS